jgi:hypothetical protein
MQGIASTNLHELGQPRFRNMLIGFGHLAGLQFGADDHPAAVVADGGSEVDRGYAERRAEFDNACGGNGTGHGVQELPAVSWNWQQGVTQQRGPLL